MPNQKSNCFFTPHPLSKHYSRQSKPYHRSNQNQNQSQNQVQNQNQNQGKHQAKQTNQNNTQTTSTNTTNTSNSISNSTHTITTNKNSVKPNTLSQPKSSHAIKPTQRTSKSSPANHKNKHKTKQNQNRHNLNFNDFSLAQLDPNNQFNLSDLIDDHPLAQIDRPPPKQPDHPPPPPKGVEEPQSIQAHRHPSPQIDQRDDRSSSLSSLTSEDDPQISDQSIKSLEHHPSHQSTNNATSQPQVTTISDRVSSTSLDVRLHEESSPHHNSPTLPENMDLDPDRDEPSELGDDVYLEYTDFGHDFGFPVTWSESEYDEDHEREDPKDEFAEFLLMDSSEADQLFGFDQLESIRNSSKYTQMIHGIDQSDDESNDGDSYLGYMVIEEFDPKEVVVQQTDDQNSTIQSDGDDGEDVDNQDLQSQSISGDDGATTDSLDEDDHSGLVRFGIEADHSNNSHSEDDFQDEQEDARFFDLPASSALGSMLRGLDFSATAATPSSIHPVGPRDQHMPIGREIKFPIMGTFSVNRKDGMNAGRTIIDEKKSPPLSPFTGGKVIRYNRFKKLRHQSCTGDSELSSVACTPKPDESQELPGPGRSTNLGIVADEFDITAFIRGISSIDDGCSDSSEKKNGFEAPTTELDGLSRWRRVPMSAFRRRMMMKSQDAKEENERLRLNGAIQTSSSLVETLSLCEQPAGLRDRRRHPPSKFLSSITNPNKVYNRHDHRRLRKTKSYNSNGKQSKLNNRPSSMPSGKHQEQPERNNQIDQQSKTLNEPMTDVSTSSFNRILASAKLDGTHQEKNGGEKYRRGDNDMEISLIDAQTTSREDFETKILNQVLDIEPVHNDQIDKHHRINSSFVNGSVDHHFSNFGMIHNQLVDLDYPPIFQ